MPRGRLLVETARHEDSSAEHRNAQAAGEILSLVLASHPRFALGMTAAVTLAAVLTGRSTRECVLVAVTVLTGQLTVGWTNDVVDRHRDQQVGREDKPVAMGWVDPSTVTFSAAIAILLLVPLSVANGTYAGVAHLGAVASGCLYSLFFQRTVLSWLPWAVAFGLIPAFLSYGGFGGGMYGDPPTVAMTVAAALLGVGIHFLKELPGLVHDNTTGVRHLPLRVALRTGAPRLLLFSSVYTGSRRLRSWSSGSPSASPSRGLTLGCRPAAPGARSAPEGTVKAVTLILRRSIATATFALAVPALSACGFDYQTNEVYIPGVGVNERSGQVDVLHALVVSGQEGSGTVIAGLVNNDMEEPDELVGVAGTGESQGLSVQNNGGPVEIPANGFVQLADEGNIVVTGDGINPGTLVTLTFSFRNAEAVELDVPVVANTDEFADVPVPSGSPTTQPSAIEASPDENAPTVEPSPALEEDTEQ